MAQTAEIRIKLTAFEPFCTFAQQVCDAHDAAQGMDADDWKYIPPAAAAALRHLDSAMATLAAHNLVERDEPTPPGTEPSATEQKEGI